MKFNDEEQNLTVLQEECAEVIRECTNIIQIVSKIKRFGLENYHPDDPDKVTNLDHLTQELGDLLAMVEILVDNDIGITFKDLDEAIQRKREKLSKFYVDNPSIHNSNPKFK